MSNEILVEVANPDVEPAWQNDQAVISDGMITSQIQVMITPPVVPGPEQGLPSEISSRDWLIAFALDHGVTLSRAALEALDRSELLSLARDLTD